MGAIMSDTTHGKHGNGAELDAMTVPQLTVHIALAQAKLKEKQDGARAALLTKWKAEAAEHNIPFEAVLSASRAAAPAGKGKPSGEKLPVKFRGPNGQEWSGRGKLPQWVSEAEKQGRKRDEFKV